MAIVNIGILAHVDAGKTSLTERILFETGVIRSLGSVMGRLAEGDLTAVVVGEDRKDEVGSMAQAVQVSAYSLKSLAGACRPLMSTGGSVVGAGRTS